jgi:hypothetical protein
MCADCVQHSMQRGLTTTAKVARGLVCSKGSVLHCIHNSSRLSLLLRLLRLKICRCSKLLAPRDDLHLLRTPMLPPLPISNMAPPIRVTHPPTHRACSSPLSRCNRPAAPNSHRHIAHINGIFLCLFRIPAANVLAMRVVRAFAQGFVFAGALNFTRMYAVCAVPAGGGGDGLGGLAVLVQAAPAELRRPPLEVCPAGQRKHLQLLAFAPLTIRKGQLGAAVGRFWGPVQPGTWLPHPGAHSACG